MIRRFAILSATVFSAVFLLSPTAHAQNAIRVSLDEATIAQGYSVSSEDGAFTLGLRPDSVSEPVVVSLTPLADHNVSAPDGWHTVSVVTQYDIRGTTFNPVPFAKLPRVTVKVVSDKPFAEKALFGWDRVKRAWSRIPSKTTGNGTVVSGTIQLPFGQVAAFESDNMLVGVASWYPAKPGTAAANAYSMGTELVVTNVRNGKNVRVRVASTGPFSHGRVIDLSPDAFKKLAPLGTGVVSVSVRAADGLAPTSEPVVQAPPPRVRSSSAFVMDAKTGQMLYEKNPDSVRPIASITKLMTGLLVLEAQIPFSQEVTIVSEDATAGARLAVAPGETVKVKNLFFSTLTGSANNAALALARATGMPRKVFVERMNSRARELGLTHTVFLDPSGLDPKNVSTAREVAMLSRAALQPLPMLQATTAKTYGFTTVNSKKTHHFKNTNALVTSPLYVTGGKTGFLDEAGYTLTLRAKDRESGREVIVVVLGADSSKQRFDETQSLAEWALEL